MPTATLTEKGQIVIPAKIRARHGLTAGTQVEFVDSKDGIRLVVHRKVAPSRPEDGYGLIRVPAKPGRGKLSDFDPAETLARPGKRR